MGNVDFTAWILPLVHRATSGCSISIIAAVCERGAALLFARPSAAGTLSVVLGFRAIPGGAGTERVSAAARKQNRMYALVSSVFASWIRSG
jgi:hypothetical protein